MDKKMLDIWVGIALSIMALTGLLNYYAGWQENTMLHVKLAFREAQVCFYVAAMGGEPTEDIDKAFKDIKFAYALYKRYVK